MKSQQPGGKSVAHIQPRLLQATPEFDPSRELKLEVVENPVPRRTLGYGGVAVRVSGPAVFPITTLVLPFEQSDLLGKEPTSFHVFHLDSKSGSTRLVENSGTNIASRFFWAEIRKPGVYFAVGLPHDFLLREGIRNLQRESRKTSAESPEEMKAIAEKSFEAFLKMPEKELETLRQRLTALEARTGVPQIQPGEMRVGEGAHLLPFPLPGGTSIKELRERLSGLDYSHGGLLEESLFLGVDNLFYPLYPFPRPHLPWPWFCRYFCCDPDWWMYHRDENHSGAVSSPCSGINKTNVGALRPLPVTNLDGDIITIPSIVQGKIYVGTARSTTPGIGGTLYRIDLATGTVEKSYSTPYDSGYYPGIGGSPAVVSGKVYFAAVPGKVHCLDANTFALLWTTDLRNADLAHNQPVQHEAGYARRDCFTSPLVVNGKVYVGCGEGEAGAYGFVYCLDANTGNVLWLFCTNQFTQGVNNAPNVIPNSLVSGVPPAPFTRSPTNPIASGASVWSSCAYDRGLNRIFVGTGNSNRAPPGVPDTPYGSGVLSLDADTGTFEGFFQPTQSDCYYPTESDIDMPSSPTLFSWGGKRVLGIGSKNGSYFLLDPTNLPATAPYNIPAPLARRQLLPRDAISGAALPNVDPGGPVGGENYFGVFGTGAVNYGLGSLFVGLGGYQGGAYGDGIDTSTTPFIRALSMNDLSDKWPAAVKAVGGNQVSMYSNAFPPLYTTPGEAGVSSPATVNDVVFVSTCKPGLYAFDAATGLELWSAPNISPGGSPYALGPAIYDNYVVVGSGNTLYRYTFLPWWPPWPWLPPWLYEIPVWPQLPPWPPPPPPDGFQPVIEEAR